MRQRLYDNLSRSLSQMEGTIALLSQMEPLLELQDSKPLEELIANLNDHESGAAELAAERRQILGESNAKAADILASDDTDQQMAADRLLTALRSGAKRMTRLQERIWTMVNVRGAVIDKTLRILCGASVLAYERDGSRSKPANLSTVQHRC